jgi:hypothetical protein
VKKNNGGRKLGKIHIKTLGKKCNKEETKKENRKGMKHVMKAARGREVGGER